MTDPTPISPGRRIRYRIEYVGFRIGLFLFDRLPLSAASAFGCGVADLFFLFGARRRRIACANIRRAGLATTPGAIRRIARASFRNLVYVAVEALRFGRVFAADSWRDRVQLETSPETIKLLEDPEQGMISVTAHLGNWEVAGRLLSFITPVTAIARKMNNPHVEAVMVNRNAGSRVTLLPKHGAGARAMLRALKQGDALAMLVDQHARSGGIRLDFFGSPASTYPTPAYLHLRTGAPIMFGYCLRTGSMRYRLVLTVLSPPTPTGDREADVRAIMAQLNTAAEAAIKEAPGQYLWAHRRWRDPES